MKSLYNIRHCNKKETLMKRPKSPMVSKIPERAQLSHLISVQRACMSEACCVKHFDFSWRVEKCCIRVSPFTIKRCMDVLLCHRLGHWYFLIIRMLLLCSHSTCWLFKTCGKFCLWFQDFFLLSVPRVGKRAVRFAGLPSCSIK